LGLKKNSKGFTLIEVLIALIILPIALLAMASLMAMTTKNNSYGNYITEASTFAQDKLEELRVTRFANLASGADNRVGCTGINFARNWNVVTVQDDDGKPNRRNITITINWNDGRAHSINIFSVFCDKTNL
jgi:type IV pilus assembly protein PilV